MAIRCEFGLTEGPYDYRERTKANVDDSDGTVVFRFKSSPGTDGTIGYAQTHHHQFSKFLRHLQQEQNEEENILHLNVSTFDSPQL